jgi:UDP-N-acetylglucosamine transferase subunit ALG13
MIFVTVGTSSTPFDRLVRAAEALGTSEDVVVQHGPSRERPSGVRCVETVAVDEMEALMAAARVVVTHSGVGSVLGALAVGHSPVVVPRIAAYGEAVDDHQLELARRLDELGLVIAVEDVADLPRTVAGVTGSGTRPAARLLVEELELYLLHCVGRVPSVVPSTLTGR